ncbi:TadE family type IV pilus minor pilin [Streptomyces sp. NPDC088785]|uniref:TadE family type IV pilus minor pilin n=1 Tax=Streptomyces sp. NPDC088785 TaxID=3365897 RepID=UPI0038066F47
MARSETGRGRGRRRGRCRDGGFVTAEAAVVLPVLVAFTMALVWALVAASDQIRCVDAARTGARAVARQEPEDAAVAATREAAPRGARVEVRRESGLVRVTVLARAAGPGPLGVELRAEAVAATEETTDPGPTAPAADGGPAATAPGTDDPERSATGATAAARSGPWSPEGREAVRGAQGLP